jgi:hypothetical protein
MPLGVGSRSGLEAVYVLLLVACAAHQRPAHTYPVPADVGRLVVDDAAFADFARPVRADLESDLAGRDPPALKERLFVLALFDALDDRWGDSVARLDRIVALEENPVARVMTGLTIRVWADARAHGGDTPEAFRAALERKLATLPIDRAREQLAMLRMMGRTFTPEVCRQLIDENLAAEANKGPIALDSVHAIAFQRYAVVRLVPVGTVIDEVLAAHGIGLPVE